MNKTETANPEFFDKTLSLISPRVNAQSKPELNHDISIPYFYPSHVMIMSFFTMRTQKNQKIGFHDNVLVI